MCNPMAAAQRAAEQNRRDALEVRNAERKREEAFVNEFRQLENQHRNYMTDWESAVFWGHTMQDEDERKRIKPAYERFVIASNQVRRKASELMKILPLEEK